MDGVLVTDDIFPDTSADDLQLLPKRHLNSEKSPPDDERSRALLFGCVTIIGGDKMRNV